jgi:hypothetical protein
MVPPEEWRPVEEFPGYSVNPLGQVRKDSTERVLEVRVNQYGVPYVGLMKNWKQHIRSLPRLVATAFIPQPNRFYDTPINLDGDRLNNRVDNLVWRPRWYARYYLRQFKERYPNPIETPVREADTDEEFPNSFAAACHYGILEREVVLSILNNTLTWPTYQKFVLVD